MMEPATFEIFESAFEVVTQTDAGILNTVMDTQIRLRSRRPLSQMLPPMHSVRLCAQLAVTGNFVSKPRWRPCRAMTVTPT